MKERLQNFDWNRWFKNILVFSSPVLAIFFGQLAAGVSFKQAAFTFLIALYGALADFFKKYTETAN